MYKPAPIFSMSSTGQRDIVVIQTGKTSTVAGSGLSFIDFMKPKIKLVPCERLVTGVRSALCIQSPWSPIPEFIPAESKNGHSLAVLTASQSPVMPPTYEWRTSDAKTEQPILSTGIYSRHG